MSRTLVGARHAGQLHRQADLLSGQHRHLGLNKAGVGADIAVVHGVIVIVVQLHALRLDHRPGGAADIHRQLGIGHVQQVVPLTPQHQ